MSSQGFYCLSERPFSPHEQLNCELVIPGGNPGHLPQVDLVLRGVDAQVLRRSREFSAALGEIIGRLDGPDACCASSVGTQASQGRACGDPARRHRDRSL